MYFGPGLIENPWRLMMITSKGIAQNISKNLILRINNNASILHWNCECSVITGKSSLFSKYVLTDQDTIAFYQQGVSKLNGSFLENLRNGDIVSLRDDGVVNVLWKKGKDDNLLFLTDYCNSNCIMCPQTQIKNLNNYYDEALSILNLVNEKPSYLCLTGGEPTFIQSKYLEIVKAIRNKNPKVALQVLTNGKNFSNLSFAKECVINSPIDTLYAVPLYSANDTLHDRIVRSKNSFKKSVTGILNLYKLKQNIEIRIVITKLNYKDLPNIAHFIYWNMPFVFHVAFMGMETHGIAADNIDEVWIDPSSYMKYLEEAVGFLNDRMLNVSIYNMPYCILSKGLYMFAKDSISEWKKVFLEPCKNCSMFSSCSGVFSTSIVKPNGIHSL